MSSQVAQLQIASNPWQKIPCVIRGVYVYRYISNCNIYIIHIQFNGCYGNRTWYLLRIPLSTIASLNNEVAQMTWQLVRPLKTSSHATSATSINQAPAISIRATPRNVSAFHTSFYILSILRHVDSLPAGVLKKNMENPIQTFGHLLGPKRFPAWMRSCRSWSITRRTSCRENSSVLCDKQVRQSSIELVRNLPVPPLLTFRMEFDYELSSSLTTTVCDPRSPLPFDMRDSPSNAKANTLNTLQKMSE